MNQAISERLAKLNLTLSLLVATTLPIVQMRNLRPGEVSDLLQVR